MINVSRRVRRAKTGGYQEPGRQVYRYSGASVMTGRRHDKWRWSVPTRSLALARALALALALALDLVLPVQ